MAATTANSDAGSDRRIRGTTTITATTSSTNATACTCPSETESPTARTATTAAFSPSGLATPSAAGTCCKKMITAMPTVNPSTTGHGMYAR